MNILLCVTGFIFCFSSWGMHDANKQKVYDTTVSIVSRPKFSGGIFYNGSNEFKIEENDQRIIGGTLDKARNDEAIFVIKGLIDGKKIREACLALGKHVSDKTFNVNTIFEHGNKRYTLISYFLYFLKDQMQYIEKDKEEYAHLVSVLFSASKGQMDNKIYVGDSYIRNSDRRIIDVMISAMTNQCFIFANSFVRNCFENEYLDAKTVFMYNLGDGEKKYTLPSLYISVLKGVIKRINEEKKDLWIPSIFNKIAMLQLTDEEQDGKDYYIKKNDQRLIDTGLCALDRTFLNLADLFCYYSGIYTNRHLDVNSMMEFKDISHAIFSFYYIYIVENIHYVWSPLRYRVTNMFHRAKKRHDLMSTYKAKVLEIISYLAENKYHKVKPYDLMSIYKEKMLEMISYLEENKYHRLARLFLKEYFSNKDLYTTEIEHNILSCYSYVLNQMEDIQIENMYAAGESQSIAKPQVAPKDLKDIMIFLEEKKCHALTNALFNEYSSNKVLDTNAVFMYHIGCSEKVCTPLALSVFYELKELEKENKVDKEFEKRKNYPCIILCGSNPLLKKCIKNAGGIRKQLFISLSENIKQYALCRRYYEHLYNKMMHYREQHREEIKKQIYNGSAMCVEIMKLILYYQFSY